jgi:hypothetical protein
MRLHAGDPLFLPTQRTAARSTLRSGRLPEKSLGATRIVMSGTRAILTSDTVGADPNFKRLWVGVCVL